MDTTLGWTFVALAALYSLGLVPRLAGWFYPTRPGFLVRLVAPAIFAALAGVCLAGFAIPALAAVAVVGTVVIATQKPPKPAAAPTPAGQPPVT